MDDMPTGLVRRGGRYSLRRRVPVDLVQHFGKREITRALRTADPKEARKLLPIAWTALDEEFERARLIRDESNSQAQPAHPKKAGSHPYERMSQEEFEAEMERLAYFEEEDRREDAEYEARAPHRVAAAEVLKRSTIQLTPEQAAFRDLLEEQRFEATLAKERLAIALIPATATAAAERPQPSFSTPTPGASLGSIVEKWARERGVGPKGVADHLSVVRWFENRMGATPLANVTKVQVLAFKDKLIEEGQTQANVKVKLSRLRTLFGYAVANALRADNPAEGVTVFIKDAERNKRPPFDLPSLKRVFASPVYSTDARPAQGRGEAAYWLPLLALYTGARLEELGQLRPQDVTAETFPGHDDVDQTAWFLHIKEDAEDGLKLKNAGSERLVPVHPALEQCGFLRFVSDAKAVGQARLFPDLRPNKYGRLTAKWGEWFSRYKREVCGVTDSRIVFHSFRHSFKHWARHVNMTEGVQRQIMGHSAKDVAEGYGSGYSHHQLVEGMAAYRVPGFNPPAPPPAYRHAHASKGDARVVE